MVELYKALENHNIGLEVKPVGDGEGLHFYFRKDGWCRCMPISVKLMAEKPVETEALLLRTIELILWDCSNREKLISGSLR